MLNANNEEETKECVGENKKGRISVFMTEGKWKHETLS